jgi:cytidine deaminase
MPKRSLSRDSRDNLIESARAAWKNAYVPFSKFRVGAALMTTRGAVFLGCNVENSSYGMTNCAERAAIFNAVSLLGPDMGIRAIAVATERNVPCSPCGACRQVIYEFGPAAIVCFLSSSGWKELPIAELLPYGFRLK